MTTEKTGPAACPLEGNSVGEDTNDQLVQEGSGCCVTEVAQRTEGTRGRQDTGQGLGGGAPEDACAVAITLPCLASRPPFRRPRGDAGQRHACSTRCPAAGSARQAAVAEETARLTEVEFVSQHGCGEAPPARWLQQRKVIFSPFWSPEVQDQGVRRVGPSLGPGERTRSRPLSQLLALGWPRSSEFFGLWERPISACTRS